MKKQLHCLCLVLFAMICASPPSFAGAADDDFSGCCKAPIDLVYWCNDLPYDFNPRNIYQLQTLFGKPQNKCYPGVWVELEPIIKLTNCETGTITRRFQVSGHYQNYEYCEQTITIKGTHHYDIRFPADLTVSCGQTAPIEELWTSESGCDLLAINVMDQNFGTAGTGCSKIFRTYRVINWCEYDGISDRVVVNRDEDCDGKPGDEDVWVLRRGDGIAYLDRDNAEFNNNPRAGERIFCNPTNPKGYWRTVRSTGYWEYTQHIKIDDKIAPVVVVEQPNPICSYTNTCDANVSIPFSVNDDCTPNDIKIKVFIDAVKIAEYSKGGNYTASGKYKVGGHWLEIHATDGCGNSTVVKIPFQVVDCKAPAPICYNGIAIRLMPTPPNTDVDGDGTADQGAMTIWATDLIASQVTDCSGIAGFSINRVGEKPSLDKTNLVITCEDLGTLYIEVYAWDKANNPYTVQPDSTVGGRNYGSCRTYILVQASENLCSAPAAVYGSVAGKVETEQKQGLEAVNVSLISADSAMLTTDATGDFTFDSLAIGKSYKIVPELQSDDYLEGVSVSDLVVLQRHIMGVAPLASPYQLIAADVNRSNDISVADILEIRKILLGLTTRFSNNTSWRFVDATYRFPNPVNPWAEAFPEEINISRMPGEKMTRNLIAVKIGDLDGSAVTERNNARVRSNEFTTALHLDNQLIKSGDLLQVPIRLPENLAAAAFALHVDPTLLDILGIQYHLAQPADFNLQDLANGNLRVVWQAPTTTSYSTDILFVLQLRARQTAQLREALGLNERLLPATVQPQQDHSSGLALQFSDHQPTSRFTLYPNAPNPFRDETTLSFLLPEAASGTMRIYDLNGRLLWQTRQYFRQGYHQLTLTREMLAAEGVLLYVLETPTHQATGKMVVLPR